MEVELGPEHERLIRELYALRERTPMSRDEQLIIDMTIQMTEQLDEYAGEARRPSRIRFTFEDFERLICSSGLELIDGRLVPPITAVRRHCQRQPAQSSHDRPAVSAFCVDIWFNQLCDASLLRSREPTPHSVYLHRVLNPAALSLTMKHATMTLEAQAR